MARLRIPIRLIGTSAELCESQPIRWETGWPALHNSLATTGADLALARFLRSESYQSKGVLPGAEAIGDDLDSAPNSRVFLVYDENQAVGTVRVTVGDAQSRLPTFLSNYFAEEVAANSGRYIEVTRLAIAHPSGSHDPRYVLALLQNVTSEADRNGARFILTALDQGHRSFYSALGFQQLSDTRFIPGWPHRVFLGFLDWVQERSRLRDSYTFHRCFSSRNYFA